MFFPPLELVEDVYPKQPMTGDGLATPWEAVWTANDIELLDPGRFDYQITGVQILPVLVPNPSSSDGSYTDAVLAGINVTNYQSWYFMVPGTNIWDTSIDYAANLTSGVLTVWFTGPSVYAVRVNTLSRPTPGGALEPLDYVFSQFVGDFFGEDGAPDKHGPKRRVEDIGQKDLTIVSSGDPNDNGFNTNTLNTLTKLGKSVDTASTIQQAIDKIKAKSNALGRPISVTLAGHGRPGSIKLGTQRINKAADSNMTPDAFGTALNGFVTSITNFSCNVANEGGGAAYMQNMANGANAPVSAWRVPVTAAANKRFLGFNLRHGYFNLGAKGKKGTEHPGSLVPALPSSAMPVLALLLVMAMAFVHRRATTLSP